MNTLFYKVVGRTGRPFILGPGQWQPDGETGVLKDVEVLSMLTGVVSQCRMSSLEQSAPSERFERVTIDRRRDTPNEED